MLHTYGGNLEPILTEIVDTAIAITGADFGNVQLLEPRSSELGIVAKRGFPEWWLKYWETVHEGMGSCGTALLHGERVIIEDVEQSPVFAGTPALDIQLRAGVRAVQSTPIMSREGKPLGMFSTHFKVPHRPDDRQLALLDLLARQAADIIEQAQSEEELLRKNADLNALNEQLTAKEEELHRNIGEINRQEQDLRKALAEKEVLLSENHHRVKNNLTAFISLLSLQGSSEDTPAGRAIRQDLQNRARSMALIHETLYRTNRFDEIDMGIYLKTLVGQIAYSFGTARPVTISVETHGVMLDLPRATPTGLIINELLTNSFKYAFPDAFDTEAVRGAPPSIAIEIAKNDDMFVMTFRDNGIGLSPDLDPTKTQSFGLKLVNFLARHQLRATVAIDTTAGTEFAFRFRANGG